MTYSVRIVGTIPIDGLINSNRSGTRLILQGREEGLHVLYVERFVAFSEWHCQTLICIKVTVRLLLIHLVVSNMKSIMVLNVTGIIATIRIVTMIYSVYSA